MTVHANLWTRGLVVVVFMALVASGCASGEEAATTSEASLPSTSVPETPSPIPTAAPTTVAVASPTTTSTTTTVPPTTTTTVPEIVYLDGAPGSCLILEEKFCFSGEGFLIGAEVGAVGFRLPKGTPLFFPWEEGTFSLTWGSSSPEDPEFPEVILLDEQGSLAFILIGFAPSSELENLEEDQATLGIGDIEGDTLNLAMEVGGVLGEPLDGYGEGDYTLVVLAGDLHIQPGDLDLGMMKELFGVVEFSS